MKNQLHAKNYVLEMESYLDLPCNVYLKDTKGAYRECNTNQAKSFGASSVNDVLGKTDMDIHPVENECRLCAINDLEIIKTEKPKIVVEPMTYVNQPTYNMLSYKIPCRSVDGKVVGVFGISIALTNEFSQLTPVLSFPTHDSSSKSGSQEIVNTKISKRERECLDCLVRGMTAKEIARILNLSPRTIEFYIENMKKKLGCSNRIKLIAKAFDILK